MTGERYLVKFIVEMLGDKKKIFRRRKIEPTRSRCTTYAMPLNPSYQMVWGPMFWKLIHFYCYMLDQLSTQGGWSHGFYQQWMQTLMMLIHSLPCSFCQEHACQYLRDHPLPVDGYEEWYTGFLDQLCATLPNQRGVWERHRLLWRGKLDNQRRQARADTAEHKARLTHVPHSSLALADSRTTESGSDEFVTVDVDTIVNANADVNADTDAEVEGTNGSTPEQRDSADAPNAVNSDNASKSASSHADVHVSVEPWTLPPEVGPHLLWSFDFHNAVNARKQKPVLSHKECYETIHEWFLSDDTLVDMGIANAIRKDYLRRWHKADVANRTMKAFIKDQKLSKAFAKFKAEEDLKALSPDEHKRFKKLRKAHRDDIHSEEAIEAGTDPASHDYAVQSPPSKASQLLAEAKRGWVPWWVALVAVASVMLSVILAVVLIIWRWGRRSPSTPSRDSATYRPTSGADAKVSTSGVAASPVATVSTADRRDDATPYPSSQRYQRPSPLTAPTHFRTGRAQTPFPNSARTGTPWSHHAATSPLTAGAVSRARI